MLSGMAPDQTALMEDPSATGVELPAMNAEGTCTPTPP